MYARMITANIQPDKFDEFPKAFGEFILPDASQERGFKGIYVLRDAAQCKITAIVLWETESDAQASIEGFQHRRLPKIAHFLVNPPIAETLEVILRA
jgi:heme-degrading monooxygenase HmoA